KDSQGLCFIGKVKLPTFLQQQLKPKTGAIHIVGDEDLTAIVQENPYREADFSLIDSQEIGTHQGAHYFTVGQRRGLNVGGRKQPVFVIGTDVETNIIYVGEGENHWALNRHKLMVAPHEIHWIDPMNELKVGESKTYFARIRYRQGLSKALLTRTEDGLLFDFEEDQKGVAAGQFVAWYEDDSLIGSGVIMA
ncbi:MAG: tRNA 2-thiouridine(34) synthase MnmA, partial [Flavobacteriaceae bacterium]|nr:tRNA 2-thiouridine(34) synthase MnmA [Flavobacteriaceae bacterium]